MIYNVFSGTLNPTQSIHVNQFSHHPFYSPVLDKNFSEQMALVFEGECPSYHPANSLRAKQ